MYEAVCVSLRPRVSHSVRGERHVESRLKRRPADVHAGLAVDGVVLHGYICRHERVGDLIARRIRAPAATKALWGFDSPSRHQLISNFFIA